LVLGNGDLNALLWERGGALCLRVTKNDIWSARLDLRRAAATLEHDCQARTVVRALADRNVFLIEGPGDVSLEEVPASYLTSAKLGVTDGVKWLHMVMPGDVDYQGMEFDSSGAVTRPSIGVSKWRRMVLCLADRRLTC
jgi:hypothetical protein